MKHKKVKSSLCLIQHQPVKIHGGDEAQSYVVLISPLGEWSDSQWLYNGCNKNLKQCGLGPYNWHTMVVNQKVHAPERSQNLVTQSVPNNYINPYSPNMVNMVSSYQC